MEGNPNMEVQDKELFERLRIGVADGASEDGVCKKGGMLEYETRLERRARERAQNQVS